MQSSSAFVRYVARAYRSTQHGGDAPFKDDGCSPSVLSTPITTHNPRIVAFRRAASYSDDYVTQCQIWLGEAGCDGRRCLFPACSQMNPKSVWANHYCITDTSSAVDTLKINIRSGGQRGPRLGLTASARYCRRATVQTWCRPILKCDNAFSVGLYDNITIINYTKLLKGYIRPLSI